MRPLYRNLAIGAAILLSLVVALGLTIYIGGAPLMIRIAFARSGTTSLVDQLQLKDYLQEHTAIGNARPGPC